MAKIEFDYNVWDAKTDVPLVNVGNDMAFAALSNDLRLGHLPTVREERADDLIGGVTDGVVEILAGALEYLRRNGYTAVEVSQRVRAFLHEHRQAPDSKALAYITDATDLPADPFDWARLVDANDVVG